MIFEELGIGDQVRIDVGSMELELNNYTTHNTLVLDPNNWNDYYLELITLDSSGWGGIFTIFDDNDRPQFDIDIGKYSFNNWTNTYNVYKKSTYKSYKPVDNGPIICTCDSHDLFWYGCRCGAFKKEQNKETDYF